MVTRENETNYIHVQSTILNLFREYTICFDVMLKMMRHKNKKPQKLNSNKNVYHMHIALGAKMKSQGPSFPYYLYQKKD